MGGESVGALVPSVKAEEKSSSAAATEAIAGAGASSHVVDATAAVTTTVEVRPEGGRGGGGCGGGGGGERTEEGEMDKDLLCPICMQIIKDAFLTACGHSFCYMCIVTHLNNKNDCPCCGHYLTNSQLFPNFLLNKVHPAEKRIVILDSTGRGKTPQRTLYRAKDMLDALTEMLEFYIAAKFPAQITEAEWRREVDEGVPKQTNGSDCGIFSLLYMDLLSRGLSCDVGKLERGVIRNMRYTLASELLADARVQPTAMDRQ